LINSIDRTEFNKNEGPRSRGVKDSRKNVVS